MTAYISSVQTSPYPPECWETALWLVTEGCIMMSDRMLISILSVSVEPLMMLYTPVSDVCLHEVKCLCLSVISLGAWPDLDWVSFP